MLEYECQKKNDLFSTIKRNTILGDTFTVLFHNLRSLPRNVDDIEGDKRIIKSDIIGFTETQMKPSDSTCTIIETLNLISIKFNNNESEFLSLAHEFRNADVAVFK